jgi:hypothetical protein
MDKIVIQIPVDYVVELATYGETGKVSKLIQLFFEKQLKDKGLENKIHTAREIKLQETFVNLKRTLGSEGVKNLKTLLKQVNKQLMSQVECEI